jgi:hypothetical protein
MQYYGQYYLYNNMKRERGEEKEEKKIGLAIF